MMPVILFVLVAYAATDSSVGGPPASQTIGYYATAAECQTELNRMAKTVDSNHVRRLDCVPIRP
jgi:hypothetical protein